MGLDMSLYRQDKEVCYWRKANHIHSWFVKNVQNDEDDCREYFVSRAKLQELRDLCQRVVEASVLRPSLVHNGSVFKDGKWTRNMTPGNAIEDPTVAIELLPTANGFFFGRCDYDELYFNKTKFTLEKLTELLSDTTLQELVYQSSW